MMALQVRGCCNINLVTPSHVAAHAVGALAIATRAGMNLPVVWNTSSYESVETLRMLDCLVDVWLGAGPGRNVMERVFYRNQRSTRIAVLGTTE